MTQQEMHKVAQLKQQAPAFAAMRKLALRSPGILRGQDSAKLDSWLDDAHRSGPYGLRRFASTVRHDLADVRNAMSEHWSSGRRRRGSQGPALRAWRWRSRWHHWRRAASWPAASFAPSSVPSVRDLAPPTSSRAHAGSDSDEAGEDRRGSVDQPRRTAGKHRYQHRHRTLFSLGWGALFFPS